MSNVSSLVVHGPLYRPTLEQHGALPILIHLVAISSVKYLLRTQRKEKYMLASRKRRKISRFFLIIDLKKYQNMR
jgi:hypothetical protein